MSASLSAKPGGQPSTMQPCAGPWLSPKLVTVNNVPKVLPDISKILGSQQKYSAAAALEFQPGEGQERIALLHGRLRITHLHHQNPAGLEVRGHAFQYFVHRIQ